MEETTSTSVGKFLDPEAILKQLDLKAGSMIADFGCGPGYFSIPFAKAVSEIGKVYSLDILPQALETVAGKAKNAGIINIVASRVNLEKENGSKLESNSIDWVILKDILFQNQNKKTIINEANRVLKDTGKVIVVEWNNKNEGVGPEIGIRIPKDELKKMFAEHGFSIEKDVDAGDFHYAFVGAKN